jgi:hypothetical protein
MEGNINTKQDIDYLINHLKNLKLENKDKERIRYKYNISRIYKTRTIDQNSYLWLINSMLAKHLDYSADEIHYSILAHLRIGYKIGRDGKERKIILNTSKLSTKELGEYIEKIKVFASTELDFYIPDCETIPLSIYEDYKIYRG